MGRVSANGVSARGVCPGDVSQHALGQTPTCGQNDRHVQTHNLSATSFTGGKN